MALLDPQDKTVVSGIGALSSAHRHPNTSISLGGLKTGDRAFSRSLSFAWSAFGDFQKRTFQSTSNRSGGKASSGTPFFSGQSRRASFFFRWYHFRKFWFLIPRKKIWIQCLCLVLSPKRRIKWIFCVLLVLYGLFSLVSICFEK